MSVDLEKTSGDYSTPSENGAPSQAAEPRQAKPNRGSRWTNDLRIVPILTILYLFNVWDRSTITLAVENNSTLFGTSQGTSKVYMGIYYFAFILFVLPTVLLLLLPRIGAKILLPVLAIGWGAMTMIQAGVSSWAGLAAVQFFLGMFQSGFWASIVTYLSTIYKRNELGVRLALIFGLGSAIGSFNGPICHTAFDNASSLAGWKVLMLVEGAITIALAPLAFVLLPSTDEVFDMSAAIKGMMSAQTAIFVVIALFLGAAASSCEMVMYQMSQTLDLDTLPEAWQLVAMNCFGFFILMFVAISSDFYQERSTHLGAALVGSLLILVNLPEVYYIHKRDSAWYNAFIIAVVAYITPLFHAWYSHNTPSTSARVGVVGIVVGAFHVGDLLGWVAFWNTTFTTATSSHKRDEDAEDVQGLKIACGYLAVAVVGIFAYGAWLKYDNRKRNRQNASRVTKRGSREEEVDDVDHAAWRWVD